MWYQPEKNKEVIDFTKPIVADNPDGDTVYLLLPCLSMEENYKIAGYNWFNVILGDWNSCVTYATPYEAVLASSYKSSARNGTIRIR